MQKLEETAKYLFLKAKETSRLVADFFARNADDPRQTMDYVLSYDDTHQKLRALFAKFAEYKARAQRAETRLAPPPPPRCHSQPRAIARPLYSSARFVNF